MFRLIFLRRSNISLFTFLGGYALVAGYLIYQVVVVLGASDQRETAPNLLLVIALFILASIQFRHIFLL